MKRTVILVLVLALALGVTILVMRSMKNNVAEPIPFEIIPDSEIPTETVSFYGATGEEAKVTFTVSDVSVELPERTAFVLTQVDSGSGGLYTNDTETITLWDKGDKVTIWEGDAVIFEGFSDTGLDDGSLDALRSVTWVWVTMSTSDGTLFTPKTTDAFTLTFDDERVSGTTDCNGLSGSYTENGDTLTISELASTRMYCEGSEEGTFSDALMNVDRYKIDVSGNLLLFFKNESGSMLMRPQ